MISPSIFKITLVKFTSNYIPQISVFLSVCLSVILSEFDFQENPSHDSLQTRSMCCPEPDDVQCDLSLYGCGQLIEVNYF